THVAYPLSRGTPALQPQREMGSTRQPDGLEVGKGKPLLQQVQAVVAPLGTAHTNSSSNRSSSTSSRPEETCPEYDRHLAWALEQDLAGVVGTRALYVAGEDLRGRTCVVFCPDLAFLQQQQSPAPPAAAASAPPRNARKRRSNFATTTNGGTTSDNVQDTSPFSSSTSSSPSSARRSPPVPRVAGALEKAAAVGASRISISRKNSSVAAAGASRANADPPTTATTVTGQRGRSNDDTAAAAAAAGAAIALESNVGSAAVERLLLYFVRLLDEIAGREYVLLLCGGGWGGWLSWGRFSMLGEMHSLLPRR
ncbi:unnamed protein product, partial [Ectocarpus sp. 12 AP-2014]